MLVEENTAIGQLLTVIPDARIRTLVSSMIDLCTGAVDDLASLDRRVYGSFGAISSDGLIIEDNTRTILRSIATETLGGARQLSRYLLSQTESNDIEDTEQDVDFDFDFGGGGGEEEADEVDLNEEDIDDAFGMLGTNTDRSSQERWGSLKSEVSSLAYALESRLRDFDKRFENALGGEHYDQSLREIDDVSNSLTDGVYALMGTIFETYLDEVDSDGLIPGHQNTLGKALLVRRGLTGLRRAINSRNVTIQDSKASVEEKQTAFGELSMLLSEYTKGLVFGAMRTADRVEIERFYIELQDSSYEEARLVCEGLDKYLDSLAQVSQRDVLQKHDRENMSEIIEILEGAEPLVEISPHGAVGMVRQAFTLADTLYGLRDDLDQLLGEWGRVSTKITDPVAIIEFSKQLMKMVSRG